MTYWCSDHQQFEHYSPHTPDSAYNDLHAEVERLRAALESLCSQNGHVIRQGDVSCDCGQNVLR